MAKPLRIAFFLITALLFAISTVFAVLTWSTYKSTLADYTPTPCRLISFNVIHCSSGKYQVVATVSLSGQSPQPASFFPDPSLCVFASEAAASDAVEAGTDRTCYKGESSVSLSLPLSINSARVRAVLTILCSLVCGGALTWAVYRRCRRGRGATWRPNPHYPHYPHDAFLPRAPAPALYGGRAAPGPSAARPLSAADTGVLVAALRARAKAPRAEQTCAICLDDVGDGMRLPCAHEFHEACVTQWLRKGGAACPCCKYDLRAEVRELREKAVRDSVRREERASGAGADEAEGEVEGEAASWASWGSYVWGWAWWARDEGEVTESEMSVEYGEGERGGVPP